VNAAPLCLAIESATQQASVALVRGQQVLAHEMGPIGQHHSESLLPMIDRVLAGAGVGPDGVETFAISIGPGAFTSLRIGLATLKGLAFGASSPVAAVPTLHALALCAHRKGRAADARPIVPVLDARRNEVYAAAYAPDALADARAPSLLPVSVYSASDLARALPGGGHLVGEGAEVVGPSMLAQDSQRFSREPGPPSVPDALSVAALGMDLLAAGQGVAAASLVPRYVRRAEAEAQRTSQPLE